MIAAAQARYPQKEVFLAGHGRGAGLVLRYAAADRPLSGAILISPYITNDQPNLDPDGWRAFASAHPGEAFLARSGAQVASNLFENIGVFFLETRKKFL